MAEWAPEQEEQGDAGGQREYACMPFELRALEVALDIVRTFPSSCPHTYTVPYRVFSLSFLLPWTDAACPQTEGPKDHWQRNSF